MTGLAGLVSFDAGVGRRRGCAPARSAPTLEVALAEHDASVGHFPQSFDLATVGGWVACRGAGQYSTRYGKIESMVVGLEVVLADGRVVRTGGAPAAAVGPDLDQLFIGSEGTLGIVTTVWLRTHPRPGPRTSRGVHVRHVRRRHRRLPRDPARGRHAGRAASLRRRRVGGVRPRWATARAAPCSCSTRATGNSSTRRWRWSIGECAAADAGTGRARRLPGSSTATTLGAAGADPQGLRRRHDGDRRAVGPARRLVRRRPCRAARRAARRWPRRATCRTATPTAPASTSRSPPRRRPTRSSRRTSRSWDAGQRAVLAGGGNLSHHHGVGLNRARFVAEALGGGLDVLQTSRTRSTRGGILNPGKLGLPSPFGVVPWPAARARQPCR